MDFCGILFLGAARKEWDFLGSYPIGSMYGIFTYIWLSLMVNVGRYTIHGILCV